jgi:RNA polymerase sigma factor (sigma-70 family)
MSSDELTSIVSIWQPRIRVYFARRCRKCDDVDDLVQEAITSIIRCYHTFSHRSKITTWIYGVCRNVLSNYYYYRDRDSRLIQRLSHDPPTFETSLPSPVAEVIRQLQADQQKLYSLYYVEGRSVREIAVKLKRPEGTVKYQLHMLRLGVRRLIDS